MIGMGGPYIGLREKIAVWRQMSTGMLAQGEKVLAFEDNFRKISKTENVVAVNSGTSALHLGILALNLSAGDEVIVPAFTFAASANAVELTGAKVVFCDIEPEYFTIDPELIANLVTPRTKAIMAVHLFGQMANMVAIKKIADDHGLIVIEDAAQAHGAELEGVRAGGWGDFAAFSFYPTKNITTGEGGAVATNSKALDRMVRLLRNQGMIERYKYEVAGLNNRMTEIAAAIGLVQLRRLESLNKKRIRNSKYLLTRLRNVRGLKLPEIRPNSIHVFHQFTVILEKNRDRFLEEMKLLGVSCGVYYPEPLHKIKPYIANNLDMPASEFVSAHCVSLPIHPGLSKRELRKISTSVEKALSKL